MGHEIAHTNNFESPGPSIRGNNDWMARFDPRARLTAPQPQSQAPQGSQQGSRSALSAGPQNSYPPYASTVSQSGPRRNVVKQKPLCKMTLSKDISRVDESQRRKNHCLNVYKTRHDRRFGKDSLSLKRTTLLSKHTNRTASKAKFTRTVEGRPKKPSTTPQAIIGLNDRKMTGDQPTRKYLDPLSSDKIEIARLADQMMAKISPEDMEKIKFNMYIRPAQRRYLYLEQMDPVTYFFRLLANTAAQASRLNLGSSNYAMNPNGAIMGNPTINRQDRWVLSQCPAFGAPLTEAPTRTPMGDVEDELRLLRAGRNQELKSLDILELALLTIGITGRL